MVIKRFVKPGSTITTDCWRGYAGLQSLDDQDYLYRTVNHELNFVDANGINTNTIEGN